MKTIRWLQLSFILLCLIAGQLHHYQWISWDVSWLMEVTKRMLHGGQYGLNYIETNPPLILYLYSLPVWLSEHVSLHDYTLIRITGYVLSLLSLVLCYVLSKPVFNDNKNLKPWLFMLLLVFVFTILPSNQFMQRENLFIILSMPYLMLVSLRFRNQPCSPLLSICIGFLAAIGFCIKPYYLLIPLILECMAYWKNKAQSTSSRYETYALVVTVSLYVISIYVFFPSYFTLLGHLILPYYQHYTNTPPRQLWLNQHVIFFYIAVLVYVMLKRHNPYQELALILAIVAVVSFGIFLLTGQPWYYHLLPMYSSSMILLLLNLDVLVVALRTGEIKSNWQYGRLLFLIVIALLISMTQIALVNAENVTMKRTSNDTINKLIRYFKSNHIKSVYTFSLHLYNITAADYSGVKIVGRLPNHWLVAFIANHPSETQKSKQAAYDYRNIVVTDLKQYPDAIIINNPKSDAYIIPAHFNYIQFLTKDPRFKLIWSCYKLDTTFNDQQIYRLRQYCQNA